MAPAKRCCTCGELKGLESFTKDKNTLDGLKRRCRECRVLHEGDPEARSKYNKRYWQANKERFAAANKEYREANKDKMSEYQREYREANKAKLAEYRRANADRQKAYNEANKPRKNEWIRKRRAEDESFRVAAILRTTFHKFVKGQVHTFDALGQPIATFLDWLQFQFEPWMTWDNYASEWEIDHVLPVSRFDMSRGMDTRVCFGWTNFQPKARDDNRDKGNSIRVHEFCNSLVSAHRFIQSRGLGRQEYQRLRESVAWLRATTSGMVKSSWMTGPIVESVPEIANPQPSS